MEIAVLIISLFTLIVFFQIAMNIGAMKRKVDKIEKYLSGFAKEHGYGQNYRCTNCNKIYEGKKEKCPNCGMEKEYD
jgi:rubrerythrin